MKIDPRIGAAKSTRFSRLASFSSVKSSVNMK